MESTTTPLGSDAYAALAGFRDQAVAVAVLDCDLRFAAVNELMAAANGISPAAHLGRSGPALLPDIEPSVWTVLHDVIASGEAATHIVRGRTPGRGDEGAWLEQCRPWRDPESGRIMGVIVTATEITEQERTAAAAARRQAQLSGLGRLAADLVGLGGQVEVAELLCRHACAILEGAAAAIAVGRSDQQVQVIAAYGYPGSFEEQRAALSEGTALAATAKRGEVHAFVRGAEWEATYPRGAAYHREAELAAIATIPLLSADTTIGALELAFAGPRSLSEDDWSTLRAMASMGGQAMERARAADERQRAARLREAFIDVMAHELKTPLATIYGGLQMIVGKGAALAADARNELLADAAVEAERIVRLVDDLVILSRLERGVEMDLREPVMLSHVAESAAAREADDAGASFRVTVPRDVPPVSGEPMYVEQVIRNLLGNARKYGKPPYELVVEPADDEVQLRVVDRGAGLGHDADRLFDLFYRDARAQREAPGSGIGLFICRELVHRMGGRTWAANRQGGGAEFGFALPVWSEDGED